jgi:Pentapeptide repeats (8 copies)
LSRANLSEAILNRANLAGATLSLANLTKAIGDHADFRKAMLSGAQLREATLRWADLGGTDLSGTNLILANLSNAELTNVGWQLKAMRGRYRGIRGLESSFVNALFKRALPTRIFSIPSRRICRGRGTWRCSGHGGSSAMSAA